MDGPAGRPAGWTWDPLVRITHWSIAAAVLLNGILTEGGAALHIWIGYAALAMLGLRLAWGLLGPEEARFAAFPPSLRAARTHASDLLAGRHRPYRSHDPLGSLMAYALWGTLLAVVATGVAMEARPFPHGEPGAFPARYWQDEGEPGEEGAEVLEEVHETAANLLLLLAALHVAGVALESRRGNRELVRAMLRGRREG
jgi:cytochrome b